MARGEDPTAVVYGAVSGDIEVIITHQARAFTVRNSKYRLELYFDISQNGWHRGVCSPGAAR
jgi:hypothetical protein